jgi:hypothetical protein
MYGLRFVLTITGNGGKFDFYFLFLSVGKFLISIRNRTSTFEEKKVLKQEIFCQFEIDPYPIGSFYSP